MQGKRNLIVIGLGVIVAAMLISPALGGPSLRKLVKKEVSKQIAKATGPKGADGAVGAAGLNGTARAYATVDSHDNDACTPECTAYSAKGITSVTRIAAGQYCVTAPGITPVEVSAAVTVDRLSAGPAGNASAMTDRDLTTGCPAGTFTVWTERLPTSGTISAAVADNVAFTIVIP